MDQFLAQVYFGNVVSVYLTAFLLFFAGVMGVYVFKRIVLRRLRRWAEQTSTQLDDILTEGFEKSLIPLAYFGVLYMSLQILEISVKAEKIIHHVTIFILTYYILKTITVFLNNSYRAYIRKEHGIGREKHFRGVTTLVNILIWGLGLMFLLDNLGFEISAVIAGLGVGGIALALAAQTVLGDLFSYFVIFFDRPFEVGDFLVIEDKMGTVEYIGIKTTRIRALGGEQMVFHNTDLTNSRIHNFKKMERRRVVFQLGVVYQALAEQLEAIPLIIREIIETQTDTVFDRAHFAKFGEFSLDFEIVYYVLGADYTHYMDIQQAINLEIFRAFEHRKIEFAYPTQTLFVGK